MLRFGGALSFGLNPFIAAQSHDDDDDKDDDAQDDDDDDDDDDDVLTFAHFPEI